MFFSRASATKAAMAVAAAASTAAVSLATVAVAAASSATIEGPMLGAVGGGSGVGGRLPFNVIVADRGRKAIAGAVGSGSSAGKGASSGAVVRNTVGNNTGTTTSDRPANSYGIHRFDPEPLSNAGVEGEANGVVVSGGSGSRLAGSRILGGIDSGTGGVEVAVGGGGGGGGTGGGGAGSAGFGVGPTRKVGGVSGVVAGVGAAMIPGPGTTATAAAAGTTTSAGGGVVGLAGLGVAAAGATRGVEGGSIADVTGVVEPDSATTGLADLDPYAIWNPERAYAARGICLIVFGTVGVLLNVFMIVAIVPNRRLRTVRNILLVHLGFVGLASSVTLTLYAAVVIFHGVWLGGRVACHAYGFILSVFTFVSVWTITALSWDKYRTIASPLHHSLTASFSKMASCFTLFWIGAISLSMPPLLGANEFIFDKDMAICTIDLRNTYGLWYSVVYLASAFLLPFVLITYCYMHIFRIARNQSSRIAATMVRMVSVIQAPISSAPQTALSIKGTKAISTILQLMGAFALTYLPFSMIMLLKMMFDFPVEKITVVLVTTLFQAAPLTNAAVYGVRNKILRASFNRYTRRKVQELCYRDRRRGSVRSVTKRSSSALRLSLLHKRCAITGAILPNDYGERSARLPVLRRTQSYPAKSLPEVNGISVGLSRTITGPYQHSLMSLNDVNSLTPVD